MQSAEIIEALRRHGLPHGELARRAGLSRETLSRWERGVSRPALEDLERVVAAAGFQLDIRLIPAEFELVERVHELLDVGPTDRLKRLFRAKWPACRDGIRAAAFAGDAAAVVGPVASALSGAPEPPVSATVDLLVAAENEAPVRARLEQAGAHRDYRGTASLGGETRERWIVGRGAVTLRTVANGVDDVASVVARARPVGLNAEDAGVIWIALVEDLLDIAQHSPWPDDALTVAALRAVLSSTRYSSRNPPDDRLEVV